MDVCIVLLNFAADRTDVQSALGPIAQACEEQANGPFADAWGRQNVVVRAGSSTSDRAPGEVACNIRATMPEAPGAEGYHEDTGGVADIEIGLDTVDGLTSGPNALSTVISHEILEMLRDPGANEWADRNDGSGKTEALEVCDRVEMSTYAASNGVEVSDFMLPSAFIPGAQGPWDYTKTLTSQYEIAPGGYAIVATAASDAGDVTASRPEHTVMGRTVHEDRVVAAVGEAFDEKRAKRKASKCSRTFRRGVRLGSVPKPQPPSDATKSEKASTESKPEPESLEGDGK